MPSLPDEPQQSKPNRAKELRDRIDTSLDGLARAVDTVRASDDFRRFLDVQAKFHRYSWHNSLLILHQCPDASRVAGFRKWKELGRHVRKSEHGIRILAPCPFKKTVTDDDGTEHARDGIYFKVVSVFDVAQTDGQALPDVDVPNVETAADTLLAQLERVASKRGIAVSYADLRAGLYGASKRGSIDVANGHATGQQAKTLAHETLHQTHDLSGARTVDRNTAELEAESVAYVVCRHFGLDGEVQASRYIALWGGDSKTLRASLERISNTARGIIDDVEALDSGKAVA
ncbi:MAG: ArdC-like ssDNA-binding domain-containing protein [Planctomycetota bacterium]|jgi:antirestriction protein ArdC